MSRHLPKQKNSHAISGAANNATLSGSETSAPSRANAQPASGAPPITGANVKKRKTPTKSKPSRRLSKSATTSPVMGAPIMPEPEHDRVDRRRGNSNKLGYQRISIACAHCRRRKIRCVLNVDEPSQRCANCARLKKDCLFLPVDQQAMMEHKSTPSNGAGSDVDSGVSSTGSPSRSVSDRTFEQHHDGPQFTPASGITTNGSYHVLPLEPGSALPNQGGYQNRALDYSLPTPDETHSWSSAGEMEAHTPPIMGGNGLETQAQGYWRYPSHQMMPSDMAPMSNDPSQAGHGYGLAHGNEQLWQQQQMQQRSMSFGQVDTLPASSGYGAPFNPQAASRYPQPSTIDAHRASHMAVSNGPLSGPVGHAPSPYYNQYVLPSVQGDLMSAPMSSDSMFQPAWYHDGPQFEPVDDALTHDPETSQSYRPN